jgi:hypothetical protein
MAAAMLDWFEDCSIDVARRELCRGGQVVRVEPQVVDLLWYCTARAMPGSRSTWA